MALRLYINGQLADLEPGQKIAQTKQVNDLNSIQNRQANYTNKFKLPKTAANVKIMDFLAVTGNTSNVPYQKNECSLYSDNGECFIHRGWAIITDGGTSYEATLYDGIINFYKAIENKTLANLGLEELNHSKNVATIKAAMAAGGNAPYTYILADYNGKTGNITSGGNIVNIDYLVPSINIKYLWDKIFKYAGCTYSGEVFNTENFKNLWMTYPKGVSNAETNVVCFEADYLGFGNMSPFQAYYQFAPYYNTADAEINQAYIITNAGYNNVIRVSQSGTYRVEVTCDIKVNRHVSVMIGRNLDNPVNNTNNKPWSSNGTYMGAVANDENATFTQVISLEANESIFLYLEQIYQTFRFHEETTEFSVKITRLAANSISFATAFSDFSIRDFMSEVVHRFGLTFHKDRQDTYVEADGVYKPHYHILTLQEQLLGAEIVDWSDKFSKKEKENYIYGTYAQNNWFRYSYNDKEASHNDGPITIANVNLPETRDVIKSKIYSPDSARVNYHGREANVYRLWEKEPVDEPEEGADPYTYKSLDKRYYFLRRYPVNNPGAGVLLFSPDISQADIAYQYNLESFFKMRFPDIIQDYYATLSRLLDQSTVVTAEMYLTDNDIINFDFRNLYYIKQLSNYFMVNKINNYIPGKPVKCELVRVKYDDVPATILPIVITKVRVEGYYMVVYFELNVFVTHCDMQLYGYGSQGQWYTQGGSTNSPQYFSFTPTGTFRVRMKSGEHISNEVEVTVGTHTVITPQIQ